MRGGRGRGQNGGLSHHRALVGSEAVQHRHGGDGGVQEAARGGNVVDVGRVAEGASVGDHSALGSHGVRLGHQR